MSKFTTTLPTLHNRPNLCRLELIKRLIPNHRSKNGSPTNWFQKHKQAAKKFKQITNGQFELPKQKYRGDDFRHRLIHRICGEMVLTSANEIRTSGPENICPHCSHPTDLSQFAGIHDLQRFVLEKSKGNAYLYANNILGSLDDYYRFYCLLHRSAYQTKFSIFLRMAGGANGCPDCQRGPKIHSES